MTGDTATFEEAKNDIDAYLSNPEIISMLEQKAATGSPAEVLVNANASPSLEALAARGVVNLFYTPEKCTPMIYAERYDDYHRFAAIPVADQIREKKSKPIWVVFTHGYVASRIKKLAARNLARHRYSVPLTMVHEVFDMIRKQTPPQEIEAMLKNYAAPVYPT